MSINKINIIYCSCGLRVYSVKCRDYDTLEYHKSTEMHKERIKLYHQRTIKERYENNKRLLQETANITVEDKITTKKIKWDVINTIGQDLPPMQYDFIKELQDEDKNFIDSFFD